MKTKLNLLAAGMFLAATNSALASTTLYVDVASTSPTAPYTNWATAAVTIQDAVDAAVSGDEIVVTNGVYAIGGREVSGTGTNRVAVDKPVVLRSVNGPQFTVINGLAGVRCVYLTNGTSLSGFTLTNGATQYPESGGGLWCESATAVISNCTLTGNAAFDRGGGAYGGTLNNCTLTGNSAKYGGGGGACQSTLNGCMLISNIASYDDGGGAYQSTLNNCTLTGNRAAYGGGGAYQSTLNGCMLTGNPAHDGGGASGCTLNNCTLAGNSASSSGGGAYGGTLNNCSLTGNSSEGNAGGVNGGTLNNCTLTRNLANGVSGSGGGASGSTLYNCIVYFNTSAFAANYDPSSILNYCCTTPQPPTGTGNLSLDPQLASVSHLSFLSPCRGAGNANYAIGTDIDGEAWGVPPSIGCDEYHAGAVTGPLSVAVSAAYTNAAVGFPVGLTAVIEGRTSASVWDFGDGIVVSNRPYASHAWAAVGDYMVALWVYNDSLPGGVSATVMVHVVAQAVHYVAAGSAKPLPPYTSWATAATNIQDAVDAAAVPGAWVLVTNGTYASGGRAVSGTMTNRVVVDKPIALWSVNGPQFTVIQGYQVPGTTKGDGAIRCVYLTKGASLSGFTLTNGATQGGKAAEACGASQQLRWFPTA